MARLMLLAIRKWDGWTGSESLPWEQHNDLLLLADRMEEQLSYLIKVIQSSACYCETVDCEHDHEFEMLLLLAED